MDYAILDELQANGRMSVADLARKIHLSSPAVHQRIKRLERAGVIKQYVALLDRERAGYDLLCFIRLSLHPQTKDMLDAVTHALAAMPMVQESYHVAGSHQLLLKVVIGDHKELDGFIQTQLMTLPGIERIETSLVLSELKTTTRLKLR